MTRAALEGRYVLAFGEETELAKVVVLLDQLSQLILFLCKHGKTLLVPHTLHKFLLICTHVILVDIHIWQHAHDVLVPLVCHTVGLDTLFTI